MDMVDNLVVNAKGPKLLPSSISAHISDNVYAISQSLQPIHHDTQKIADAYIKVRDFLIFKFTDVSVNPDMLLVRHI